MSTSHRGRTAAGLLTLLEALVVLGFGAFWAYEVIVGAADDATRAVTSGLLIVLFGIALLVLARGWFGPREWPRTPTVLWNVLLLPVAWSLRDAGRTPLALAVAVVAIVSVVVAVSAPRVDETA